MQMKLNILSDFKWNNVDVQIYKENKLIYFKQDMAFMQTMGLNTFVKGSGKRIELNKLGKDFEVEGKAYMSKSVIGKQSDEIRDLIAKSNYSIRKRLEVDNGVDNNFLFISPEAHYFTLTIK